MTPTEERDKTLAEVHQRQCAREMSDETRLGVYQFVMSRFGGDPRRAAWFMDEYAAICEGDASHYEGIAR